MAYVRALNGFIAEHDGVEVIVHPGDLVDADHPVVKRTPADWWGEPVVKFQRGAEEAVSSKRRAKPKPAAAKAEESDTAND